MVSILYAGRLLFLYPMCAKKTFLKFSSLVFLSSVFLVSCHNNKQLIAENIDYLYIDYGVYTQNNLGVPFPGTVSAQLLSGESVKLESNKGFGSSNNFHAGVNDELLTVYASLPDYKTSRIPVQLVFMDKDGVSVNSKDTVNLNFRGNGQVQFNGKEGNIGQTGEAGKADPESRSGLAGGTGGNGQNGFEGDVLEIHCWQKGDTLFFHLLNTTRNQVWRTMLIGSTNILEVQTKGGTGGRGGQGGEGFGGKNGVGGSQPVAPGRGGNGGQGGPGGFGGRGGNVTIYVHPSVTTIETQLTVDNSGGAGGAEGPGGKGGKAGTPVTYQEPTASGSPGAMGDHGGTGMDGKVFKLVQEFDYTKWM